MQTITCYAPFELDFFFSQHTYYYLLYIVQKFVVQFKKKETVISYQRQVKVTNYWSKLPTADQIQKLACDTVFVQEDLSVPAQAPGATRLEHKENNPIKCCCLQQGSRFFLMVVPLRPQPPAAIFLFYQHFLPNVQKSIWQKRKIRNLKNVKKLKMNLYALSFFLCIYFSMRTRNFNPKFFQTRLKL